MKLYTRTGDEGDTGLVGGQRVGKDHLRVEAYGTVDELNAMLGLAATACDDDAMLHIISVMQHRLFEVGADLATPKAEGDTDDKPKSGVPRISDDHVAQAERFIDGISDQLAPMQYFILPGGTELAARLHAARTVCRRAERLCVALSRSEPVGQVIIVYLNRVSDLLFAMARRANQVAGVPDVPWTHDDSATAD